MKAKNVITELLSGSGITINGDKPWDIQVHKDRFYQRLLSDAALGLGESYMDGWWDCEALDEFINRILRARLDRKVLGNWKIGLHVLKTVLFNRQKKSRSRRQPSSVTFSPEVFSRVTVSLPASTPSGSGRAAEIFTGDSEMNTKSAYTGRWSDARSRLPLRTPAVPS